MPSVFDPQLGNRGILLRSGFCRRLLARGFLCRAFRLCCFLLALLCLRFCVLLCLAVNAFLDGFDFRGAALRVPRDLACRDLVLKALLSGGYYDAIPSTSYNAAAIAANLKIINLRFFNLHLLLSLADVGSANCVRASAAQKRGLHIGLTCAIGKIPKDENTVGQWLLNILHEPLKSAVYGSTAGLVECYNHNPSM